MSVGHAARLFEQSGIPTVVIQSDVFRLRAMQMKIPRALLTHHPMGRPVSAPGDTRRQRAVLEMALELLESATGGGTIKEMPGAYLPAPKTVA